MKQKNEIKQPRPLDLLRQEKAILKAQCEDGESRLGEHWDYFHENMGSLLLTSAASSVRRRMGFGGGQKSRTKEERESGEDSSSFLGMGTNTFQKVLNGIIASTPILWDMVQPMLINMMMDKLGSLFSGSKKPKELPEETPLPPAKKIKKKRKPFWKR